MTAPSVNIFEVLDNFFGSQHCPPVEQLNNRQIRELREHVLRFYSDSTILPTAGKTRLFLGSFLSSPPFTIESSPYISSALLCSDSIALFDPLHYWFCEEQYLRERLMSAPTGWKNLNTGKPDYAKTKQYISHTLPWLYNLRPLIDAELLVLIPSEQVVFSSLAELRNLTKEIGNLLEPVERLADEFSPDEITTDDNRQGLFVFAGGNRVIQIRHAINRGIEQFAKDVIIADTIGAIYTVPFRWEQHLCKRSFNEYGATKYHTNIIASIPHLRLPLLANLSPEVLVKVHKDSKYDDFRRGLAEVLNNIDVEVGSQDFANRVAEIESEILLPKIEAIYQEVQSNKFKTLTNALQEGFTTFGQTFVGNVVSGVDLETTIRASGISGVTGAISSVLEKIIKGHAESSERRIWIQLLPEKPSLSVYGSSLTLKQEIGDTSGWEIDQYPSQKIRVSKGVLKIPWEAHGTTASQTNSKEESKLRHTSEAPQPATSKRATVSRNAPCPCGSGRKYKYCHGKKVA